MEGISCFATLEGLSDVRENTRANAAKRGVPMRMGEYSAELRLVGDEEETIEYAPWGRNGHLTIWAPGTTLREGVARIVR